MIAPPVRCDHPGMGDPEAQEQHDPRVLALKAALLLVWAIASFGVCFFARDMQWRVGAWPFDFWMAAQGSVLVFLGIVVFYAARMKRLAPDDSLPPPESSTDA